MLAKSSLQPFSIPTYRRAWKLFYQFLNAIFQSVVTELPISPHTLALFIAYMYDKHYAPSTVSSYVSALGYSHRLLSFPDPTKAFFIIQMLKGYTKLGSRLDSRLPITLPILHRIIEGASQLAISQFVCPVLLLLEYLAIRGNSPGPLFMTQGNSPVSRSFFTDLLTRSLRTCGLNPALYKDHSFRIGAASFAADRGMSDAQIRALGRWKSNAFLKYIRIPSMST